jgi:hypothetical protein
MRGVSVNVALIGCLGPSDAHLLQLDTREMTTIDMPERGYNFQWFDIGRHWLVAYWTSDVPVTVYFNRRTRVTLIRERFESGDLDLDLERPTSYAAGHAVWLRDGPFTLKDIRPTRHTQRLVLARAGGRRTILSRCPQRSCGEAFDPTGAALAAGFAAWTESPLKVRAYDARAKRRFAWNVDLPDYDAPRVAGLTRRHVFVSVRELEEPGRVKLLWARVR